MASETFEKEFRRKIRVRASSPHGLACAKARARWHALAAVAHQKLWDEAMQWRQDFDDCSPNHIKDGNGQISDADPDPRCYPTNLGKRCTCVGYVSVRAWVTCADEEYAEMLGEGDVEEEVG